MPTEIARVLSKVVHPEFWDTVTSCICVAYPVKRAFYTRSLDGGEVGRTQ
jgi:hypothetical protein